MRIPFENFHSSLNSMRLKYFDINAIELMKGKKNFLKNYQYLSVEIAAVAAVDDVVELTTTTTKTMTMKMGLYPSHLS